LESGRIDPHFLDLGLDEWSASRPGRFTPGERAPGTHSIGGWVEPTAGLNDVKKRKSLTLPGIELRPLGRPARSQSLYRLLYLGFSYGLTDLHFYLSSKCNSILFKGRNNRSRIIDTMPGPRLWPAG
jgi:hypothetical protein